ncbi:MAG: AraC family transcriptional regulator [Bacteroidetes bacterium]|nr:AraC family transcriptional regulator [Bacteroidota bacterium]
MDPVYFKVPRYEEESIRVENWNQPKFYEPFHYHEECQLTLILYGSGTVFLGNSIAEYSEGDLFFIGENMPHVLRSDRMTDSKSDFEVRAISVFFSIQSLSSIFREIPEASEVAKLLEDSSYGLRFKAASLSEVGRLMKSIGDSSRFSRLLTLLQIINLFAVSPGVEKLSVMSPAKLDHLQRKNLNKVFDYVMLHYNEKITLESVASLVYMTPNAFCRYFKKHTQKSFSSFLIEVRVNKACKMLQDETNSVSDSCYSSGYNNKSNFHRHFLRIVGLTPNEYKRKLALT